MNDIGKHTPVNKGFTPTLMVAKLRLWLGGLNIGFTNIRLSLHGIGEGNVKHRHHKCRGFTLIELIVYIAGATMLLIGFTVAFSYTHRAYQELTAQPRVERIGVSLTDFIIRNIRSGEFVDVDASELGTTTGALFFHAREDSDSITKYIALENGRVRYENSTGVSEYITPDDITISELMFTFIETPVSESVRFDVEIVHDIRDKQILKTFNGFAILRYSY